MVPQDQLVLPIRKGKMLMLAVLTGLFAVSAGLALLIDFATSFSSNSTLQRTVLVLALLLGSYFLFTSLKKLVDSSAGLIVDANGIFDNVGFVTAGFIPWTDVIGITEDEESYKGIPQKLIVIRVRHPERYHQRGGPIIRLIKRINLKLYGGPSKISASSLNISHEELRAELEKYFAKYGKARS